MPANLKLENNLVDAGSPTRAGARVLHIACLLSASLGLVAAQENAFAQQQPRFETSQQFQSVFITGAYSGAFGAALGAALLPFVPNPSVGNLRFIAGGASIGFIAGSLYEFARWHRLEADPFSEGGLGEGSSWNDAPHGVLTRGAAGYAVGFPSLESDFRSAQVGVVDLRF